MNSRGRYLRFLRAMVRCKDQKKAGAPGSGVCERDNNREPLLVKLMCSAETPDVTAVLPGCE